MYIYVIPIRFNNVSTYVDAFPPVYLEAREEWIEVVVPENRTVFRTFQPNGTVIELEGVDLAKVDEDEYGAVLEAVLDAGSYRLTIGGQPVSEEYRIEEVVIDVRYSEKYVEDVEAIIQPAWVEGASIYFVETCVFPSVYLVAVGLLALALGRCIS